jgi:hypothetical protein
MDCFRLQVIPTPLGPTDGASLCLRTGISSFYWAQLSWNHLQMETEASLRNVVLSNKGQKNGKCAEL